MEPSSARLPPSPSHPSEGASDSRLLLVDDDDGSRRLVSDLAQAGFDVVRIAGGPDAAASAVSGEYGLVVLDVRLRLADGFALLAQVRRTCGVPVIVHSARADTVDRIAGLELGADDYVRKPCHARELVARIRAVLRRPPRPAAPGRRVADVDDVRLDDDTRTVSIDGRPVELTSVEFGILRALLLSAGHAVGRDAIAEGVLGRRFYPLDRSIDMHVSRVRRKLGPRRDGDERIKSVRGVGYVYTRAETF